jgi:N-acetylneuraminic acid mutarotase
VYSIASTNSRHVGARNSSRELRLVAIAVTAIVLLSFDVAHASISGPAAGGNIVTITGKQLGKGSDITNVTLCDVVAEIQRQTPNSVTVVAGPGGSGTGNILVYSASVGVTTFVNGYTYNPPGVIFGTSGWSSISNLPAARWQLGTVSANGKIYAVGGADDSFYPQSSVYVYDPAQPAAGWLTLSNLPERKWRLGAASVKGKIYAIGGDDGTFYPQTTVYVYDPSQPTQGWSSVSNFPAAGDDFPAVGVNGKLYVVGGWFFTPGNPGFYDYRPTVYVYDPSQPTSGWLTVSNLPDESYVNAATAVNGKIYAFGVFGDVYIYDPSQPTQGWLTADSLPAASIGMATVCLNGKIYTILEDSTCVYVYDPAQPTLGWMTADNLPAACGLVAGATANDKIYLLEGGVVYESSFARGVVPFSGLLAGGNTVTISGNNLGNRDVTSVKLCGVPATILEDNSPTQIVVSAGAAAVSRKGNVVVRSASYGATVARDAYTYLPPAPDALPATDAVMYSFNANWTRVRGMTQYVLDVSTTSNFTSYVARYTNLNVGNLSTFCIRRLNPLTTYYYRVRCRQNGVTSSNSSTISVQTPGGLSVNHGPASGGNTLTIAGIGLGNGSDITSVTICGIAALIQSQTANSVTVVVVGGGTGTGDVQVCSASAGVTTFASAYTYDPPRATVAFRGWSSIRDLPGKRSLLAAASVDGKVYAMGGFDEVSDFKPQSSVYVYDPARPSVGWLSVSSLPMASADLAAVSVNEIIYAIGVGGMSGSGVYAYDPSRPMQGWLSVSNLPMAPPLGNNTAATTVNSKIYALGLGASGTGVYVYDTAQPTQGWLSVSNLPAPSFTTVAAVTVNGKVYALGLGDSTGVYVYDPLQPTQGWLSVANLPVAGVGLAAVSVNGKVYVVGMGENSTGVYVYDPSRPTAGWMSVRSLPVGLWFSGVASVNGTIYVIGGVNDIATYSTVYEGSITTGDFPSLGRSRLHQQ